MKCPGFIGWKKRWFKLVIVISEESARTGPVWLEYYEKESSVKPKGVINLCDAVRICEVEDGDTKAKAIKKVSESVLFKIVTNDRTLTPDCSTHCCTASCFSGVASTWLSARTHALV